MLPWGADETCCRLSSLLPIKTIGLCPAPARFSAAPNARCCCVPTETAQGKSDLAKHTSLCSPPSEKEIVGDRGIEAQFRTEGAVKSHRSLGCEQAAGTPMTKCICPCAETRWARGPHARLDSQFV